jgi:DNA topoisomerase-1
MKKVLIIVESPAKAKAIKRLLGNRYEVQASLGHVRDLPKSQFGVDVDHDFLPKYITIRGKGDIIKSLRESAKKVERILLGPDPDREGEAIAWHLHQILGISSDQPSRIEFHEITKGALEQAVKHPRQINQQRVDAQQGRRVLDRLVGYNLSPLLWRKIKRGLSAGRVQSVVVSLICDREQEIKEFVSEEFWTLTANLLSGQEKLEAKLVNKGKGKVHLGSESEVQAIISEVEKEAFTVSKITRRERKRNPQPPFTTSTLQQEAGKKLNFPVKKTMILAQQLYEGLDSGKDGTVGLITYMRTDSNNVSLVAQQAARDYITESLGKNYVPEKPNTFKKSPRAQEAHEAIRPTSVTRIPIEIKKHLTRDQARLYKLIWERFIASQMGPEVIDLTTVDIQAGEYLFHASGSVVRFPGFTRIYDDQSEEDSTLPEVQENEVLTLSSLLPKQHFTQPLPRYTEASLVKTLEEKGIGRPSTYAPIIETIQSRGYVLKEEKVLYPTELGIIVIDLLKEYFPRIIDVEFTAGMEEKLDQVEDGEIPWQQVVGDFYQPFKENLDHADQAIGQISVEEEQSEEKCPKCGRNLTIKQGRYGKFLACPGFPECRHTQPYFEDTGVHCPLCQTGRVVLRRSKRGRRFYGCSNYPQCDFNSWDEPVAQNCPVCDHFLVIRGRGQRKLTCPVCGKSYEEQETDKD